MTVAVFSASLYGAALVSTGVSMACPAALPATYALWSAAHASGSMLVSPFDPITAVAVATTTVATGPV